MKLGSHITPLPYGDNVALWNNLTGRHIVISTTSFTATKPSALLQKRLLKMSMVDGSIKEIHLLIPHRNRYSIVVENKLWSPIPSQHHSGGYIYHSILLTDFEKQILTTIDGRKNIDALAQLFHVDSQKIYTILLPFLSFEKQIFQLRKKPLGPKHPALLQMISPRRESYKRKEHMYDEDGTTQLHDFHQFDICDSKYHFDDVEITLAHALEPPHPCLQNRSFGVALSQVLCSLSSSPPQIVLELGAGTGAVAKSFYSVHQPQRYIRMDASPVLLTHQKKRIPQSEHILGSAPPIPLQENSIDLFICNEVIADLSSCLTSTPKAQEWIQKYQLHIPKEQELVNIGSWELLESLFSILKSTGLGYISEFGSIDEIPEETTHLNHPEVSIHFGLLQEIAQKIGFSTRLIPITDLLQMSLEEVWLSKHSFMALRACWSEKELHFPAQAYHPSTFDSQFDIHGLEWCTMNERGPAPLPQRIWSLLLWKKEGQEKNATNSK